MLCLYLSLCLNLPDTGSTKARCSRFPSKRILLGRQDDRLYSVVNLGRRTER